MRAACRRDASLAGFACLVAMLVTAVLWGRPAGAGALAGELVAQPSFGAPAVTFLGASQLEAPGEVWATASGGSTLARYTDAGGWETVPRPVGAGGQTIARLRFAQDNAGVGRTTPRGGIAIAASAEDEVDEEGETIDRRLLVVREPGGALREAPAPPSGLLGPKETYLGGSVSPLLAAIEGSGGATRAFVVPSTVGVAPEAVLSLAAGTWSRAAPVISCSSAVARLPKRRMRPLPRCAKLVRRSLSNRAMFRGAKTWSV